MSFGRLAAMAGLALGVMAVNVGITVAYMIVYSHAIDPGHDKAYYEAHVQVAAPYCSIVAGIPLMLLAGRWVGWPSALIVWIVYGVIDVTVFLASGPTMRMGLFVAVSLLTKLASAWLGSRWAAG